MKIWLLRLALVLIGLFFIFALYPMMLYWPSGWVWIPPQPEYEQMILGIYATLGLFLLIAAWNPEEHRSMILFTIWSSIVHGAIMLVQALRDSEEFYHLFGDVPALFLVAFILTVLLPKRTHHRAGKKINGVDIESLKETVSAIQKDPELAKAQFRARNRWIDGGHNQVLIQGYYAAGEEQKTRKMPFIHDVDEPPTLFGNDAGASPVEYLLTALSSCMTTSIIYHAAANGIRIDSLESEFKGDLDARGLLDLAENVPIGYQKIEASFRVKTDADPEKLVEFYHLSPVYSMVSCCVPIDVAVTRV